MIWECEMLRVLTVIILVAAAGAAVAEPAGTNSIRAGRIALEDGFAVVAEEAFRAVLKTASVSASDIAEAQQGILQALLLQEKYGELMSYVDLLLDKKEITDEVAAYWHAMVLYREKNYSESMALLATVRTNMPAGRLGESALRLLALAQLKNGDVVGAVESFERFAKQYPKSDEMLLNRLDWGKALVFEGKLKEAVTVFKPVMKAEDTGYADDARYWTGRALLQLNELKKGIAVLEPLLSGESASEDLYVNAVLAVVEARRKSPAGSVSDIDGDIKRLRDVLVRVKEKDAGRRLAYELCMLLLGGGRLDEAAPLIKSYVTDNPDEVTAAELQLKLGDALLATNRNDEAVVVYRQYLEVFADAGDYARARQGSGWALLGAGRYAEAATAFEKAYDLFKESQQKMDSLFKVADSRFLDEQYKTAISVYKRFLKEFPESELRSKAMFQIGACLEALGKSEESERAFEAVVSQHGGSAEAADSLLRIGAIRESRDDWTGAEALFERMMKLYPDGAMFARAIYGRGMARYRQWLPNALNDFERIVREFPDSEDVDNAFFMRAMSLYRLGRDESALAVCEEFMKRYADSDLAPQVLFWIGRFAYNIGDYKRAEEEFSSFVNEFPKHKLADSAVYRAGMTALKRKEYVHAIELFGQLVKRYPESEHLAEARFYQADAMCELGKFSAAILVFDEVINNFPESMLVPLAWGRKGDCLFTLGAEDAERYKEAVHSYRVVTQSPQARKDHILQAEYKIARSLDKQGMQDEALAYYYSKVMVPFLLDRESGKAVSESEKVWFTRAALAVSDIVSKKEDWRQLIRILSRIVEADVAISSDAKKRIKVIESEKWWLFY
jgi:TolA-binding protein